MTRTDQNPRKRDFSVKRNVCATRPRRQRTRGILFATLSVTFTSLFVLFSTTCFADDSSVTGKRARAELTPSFGLTADFLPKVPAEPLVAPSLTDNASSQQEVSDPSLESSVFSEQTEEQAAEEVPEVAQPLAESTFPAKSDTPNATKKPTPKPIPWTSKHDTTFAVSKLDSLVNVASESSSLNDGTSELKERIVQLAIELVGSDMNASANEPIATDDADLIFEEELSDLYQEQVETPDATEDEDSEPAFAYSNPGLAASPLGVTRSFSPTVASGMITSQPPQNQEPIKVAMGPELQVPRLTSAPRAIPSPTPIPYAQSAQNASTFAAPIPELSVLANPSSSVVSSNVNPNVSSVMVPNVSSNASVPTSASSSAGFAQSNPGLSVSRQDVNYAQPQTSRKSSVDNFHAKSDPTFNGKLPGKTYRTFDASSFSRQGATSNTKTRRQNEDSKSSGNQLRNRFAFSEPRGKDNHIVQVSNIVRGASYDEDDEVENEQPVIAWSALDYKSHESTDSESYDNEYEDGKVSSESFLEEEYSNEESESEDVSEDVNEEVESEPSSETNSSKAHASRNNVKESKSQHEPEGDEELSKSDADAKSREDDGRLFPNLRPFKRIRERRLFRQDAPAPPSVDELELKHEEVEIAKEPLLTRESASLPPLSVATSPSYGDEVQETPVTRSELEKLREEAKGFSWSKGSIKVTPYGFLNLSVASDTQRSVPGDYILYVQSEEVDKTSGFSVDARMTRLGVKVEAGRIEQLNSDVGGALEFDFEGYANGSRNKGGVQLRHAYVELTDKQHERHFLFGQYWDVISPGGPQMLNYLPLGFFGDIQYRRAQARFEQGYTASEDLHFLTQIAACDNVIGDYASTSGVSARSSGWPIIEGRVVVELFKETFEGRPITIGISGHIGEQNYKFSKIAGVPMSSTTEDKSIKTWSGNVDFETPLGKTHKLHGEYYYGANLSTFTGAINQGIDLFTRDAIEDEGGWLAFHSSWTSKMATNLGYGFDKPKRSDLIGTSSASNGITTSRTKNTCYFANVLYNWTPNFMTGLEVSYCRTDYQKADISGSAPIFYAMKPGRDFRTVFTTRLTF